MHVSVGLGVQCIEKSPSFPFGYHAGRRVSDLAGGRTLTSCRGVQRLGQRRELVGVEDHPLLLARRA